MFPYHKLLCNLLCNAGVDCVIVKSGKRICGTGAALANSPLVQDKSYFEVKIQCEGNHTRLISTSDPT